jgi:hypothetical protein
MTSWGYGGLWVGGLYVGSFKPDLLVWGEFLGRGKGSFPFHDFNSYLQCCRDFSTYLVQYFKTLFDSGDVGSEIDWGNKFRLKTVPDFERGMACSAVGSDVVGEFGKGEEVGPVVLLEVTKYVEKLFDFLIDTFCFAVGLWVVCSG